MDLLAESQSFCRTCGRKNTEMKSISKQEKFGDSEMVIYDVIMECASVQVRKDDDLPQYLCKKCFEELKTAFAFKKRCEKMDLQFRTRVRLEKTIGDMRIKTENDLNQEAESSISYIDVKHEPATSVKPEEEQVEFDVVEPYSCEKCDVTYNGLASYETHYRTMHGDPGGNVETVVAGGRRPSATSAVDTLFHRNYKCDVCSMKCISKKYLAEHLKTHVFVEESSRCDTQPTSVAAIRPEELSSKVCDIKRKSAPERHPTTRKLFKCDFCDYSSANKSTMKRHKMTHTGEKPYSCEDCDYSCITTTEINRHKRTAHTGDKPHKCDLCGRGFLLKSNMKTHRMSHTGEKRYQCDLCDYSCITKWDVKRHTMTHTGEKPVKCDLCDYSCILKSYLRQHMMTHTREKPFKCVACDLSFVHKSQLRNHLMTHTGEKPFRCDVCDYSCIQRSQLITHKRKQKH